MIKFQNASKGNHKKEVSANLKVNTGWQKYRFGLFSQNSFQKPGDVPIP
jgi:hypothetical protein